MKLNHAQIAQLKEFVKILKAHPDVLLEDDLDFFRQYLKSLGAVIPEKEVEETSEEPIKEPEVEPELEPEPEPEPEMEQDIPEPVDPDVIMAEPDAPQPMGNLDAEVSEENREKAQELRGQATDFISMGDLQAAVEKLTEAITQYNGSASPLYTSRAQSFLKLKKPASAIRDCDVAIKINPDSAGPYRVRGRARALLGQWSGAAADLRAANQRDYDPDINELLKTVAKKADEAAARQKQRDEIKRKRESKSKPGPSAGKKPGAGGGGIPSWLSEDMLNNLMKDPDILSAMQDPATLPILTEIMKDPSSAAKHKDNPKISKLVSKFANFIPTS